MTCEQDMHHVEPGHKLPMMINQSNRNEPYQIGRFKLGAAFAIARPSAAAASVVGALTELSGQLTV